MIAPRFKGIINFDKALNFRLKEISRWGMWLSTKFKEGEHIEIIIKKWKRKKSNQQNKYYWGVIISILSAHTGYTKEEMHEALKVKFLKDVTSISEVPKFFDYKKLSTVYQEEYHDRIRVFAATDLGVNIPLPNECNYEGIIND